MPEVVFCQGKTPDQVVAIVGRLLTTGPRPGDACFRRDRRGRPGRVPQARWHQAGRRSGGDAVPLSAARAPFVAVVTAGTSDIPVAEEAALTLEFLGHLSGASTTWASPASTG